MKKVLLILPVVLVMTLLCGCFGCRVFEGLYNDYAYDAGATETDDFATYTPNTSDTQSTTTTPATPSQKSSEQSSNAASSKTSSKASSVAQSSANSSKPTTQPIQTMKYYISNYSGASLEEYIPRLMLKNDGTFILIENLYEGMGEYSGTYTIAQDRLVLSVKSIDFMGFAGDDLKTIDFTIKNKNQLILNTDLCASRKDSIFSIKS